MVSVDDAELDENGKVEVEAEAEAEESDAEEWTTVSLWGICCGSV